MPEPEKMPVDSASSEQEPEAGTPAADAPGPEKLLAQAQQEAAQAKDAWLRAVAEQENIRKRAQADVAAAHKFALEGFAGTLLPVKDSLESALAADNASPEHLRSGVELTLKLLDQAFEKHRIVEINPAPGEKFDPHRHQAMCAVESDAHAPNTVMNVMQKGYALNDRVLRPALVTVAKAKEG